MKDGDGANGCFCGDLRLGRPQLAGLQCCPGQGQRSNGKYHCHCKDRRAEEAVRGAAGLVAGEATTERDAWRKSGVGVRENPEFGVQFN